MNRLYARRSARRPGGYTLMELLVTMTLASVLLSLGMGAFMTLGKTTSYNQTMRDTASLINKVRNASSRFPAALVIDTENGLVYGRTDQILQELHFEVRSIDASGDVMDFARGINGLECEMVGGEHVAKGGRMGGALKVSGGGIDCGNYAPYDVTDGISAELWVKPDRMSPFMMINKGGAFSVRVMPSSKSNGKIKVSLGLDQDGIREDVSHTVEIPATRPGTWFGIMLEYDRNQLRISTDDGFGPVLRGSFAETRPIKADENASLRVGSDLVGLLDDFRFGGVAVEEPMRLREGVSIEGPNRTIFFSRGKLDGRFHPGVETIVIAGDRQRTAIEIGQSGSVQDVDRLDAGQETLSDSPDGDGDGGAKEE